MLPTPPKSAGADLTPAREEGQRASLGIEIEAMRATLVCLLQDVVDAETRLSNAQAAQLVEANEQLLMAALASQEKADTAAMALTEAERAPVLDALTGLPTRPTLLDRFGQAMAQARRHGSRLALLFVDLDDFKQLNDRHGHAHGDRVLRVAAERLVSAVREGDTVSRHGGDEFLILLAEIHQPADAQAVADKLVASLGVPAVIDDEAVHLTACVGVAIWPDDGEDLDVLTAHADAAMYARKRARAGSRRGHAQGIGSVLDAPAAPAAAAATSAAPQPAAVGPGGSEADPLRRLADLREANERLVLATLGAQELQAAAEAALQRQSTFLAAVADELGNPMAPIRIATSMLGRLPGEEPLLPRVQQVIERQMAQLSSLIGRLVEASANETGALELDQVWVDMVAVVEAAIATYRPNLQRHRLRLGWLAPPASVGVVGDAARLEQIVANLLDHACTHTPDGGRVGVTLAVGSDELTLTVADDGFGIAVQVLPKVFEPFVLDLQALDFNGAGLGVGLTVARALVHAHGGRISAHSDGIRRGSRFVVTLPLATGGPDMPMAAAPATAGDAGAPH